MRNTEKECVLFDCDGLSQVSAIPCGFNDDGSPVDDGVTSEWGMTLAGMMLVRAICTYSPRKPRIHICAKHYKRCLRLRSVHLFSVLCDAYEQAVPAPIEHRV
eukprot:5129900-Pleurochrysis_carterae.AAC.1